MIKTRKPTANKAAWLTRFKKEFQRRTGLAWNESQSDEDAISWYFPEDTTDAVLQYIEKYDLEDLSYCVFTGRRLSQ